MTYSESQRGRRGKKRKEIHESRISTYQHIWNNGEYISSALQGYASSRKILSGREKENVEGVPFSRRCAKRVPVASLSTVSTIETFAVYVSRYSLVVQDDVLNICCFARNTFIFLESDCLHLQVGYRYLLQRSALMWR